MMIGHRINLWLRICWTVLAPCITLVRPDPTHTHARTHARTRMPTDRQAHHTTPHHTHTHTHTHTRVCPKTDARTHARTHAAKMLLATREIGSISLPIWRLCFLSVRENVPWSVMSGTSLRHSFPSRCVCSLQGILIFMFVTFEPLRYNRTYEYPGWAQALGMSLAFSSMVCIPAYTAIKLLVTPGTFREVSPRGQGPAGKGEGHLSPFDGAFSPCPLSLFDHVLDPQRRRYCVLQRWRVLTTPLLSPYQIPEHWDPALKERILAEAAKQRGGGAPAGGGLQLTKQKTIDFPPPAYEQIFKTGDGVV